MLPSLLSSKICVIGMGYVGLPLAIEIAKKYRVVGFDINRKRILELREGIDVTNECSKQALQSVSDSLSFESENSCLSDCNVYIVTVPTPINHNNKPNLEPLINASSLIGEWLSSGNIVIYESTVYPGVTEDICAPILSQQSGLSLITKDNSLDEQGFYVGYSPERINPGDKLRGLKDIIKVTSGCSKDAADFVDDFYKTIIIAGTHKAETIKIAEAAKVIENIQRDVNIALVNELAILFEKLDLDTEAVLKAAGTKWNFLPFRPGLVGGHCIGVDPYYLTHKAEQIGHHTEIILAGRRINNQMSQYASARIVSLMLSHKIEVVDAKILVLGLTFKENCPDTRNSKVVNLVKSLADCNADVNVFDPHVKPEEVPADVNEHFIVVPEKGYYDCIVLAVSHAEFIAMGVEKIREFGARKHVLFDLKYVFDASQSDGRL